MDIQEIDIKLHASPYPIEMQINRNGFWETKYTTPAELKAAITKIENSQSLFILPDLIATNLSSYAAFYRPPQMTTILLAGEKTSVQKTIQIPTPSLILVLSGKKGSNASLSVLAIKEKERPGNQDVAIYHAPFPNISPKGGICMGNSIGVPFGFNSGMGWLSFWSSAFGNHSASGKSKKYPEDIRLLLAELANQQEYPLDDLVPGNITLGEYFSIEKKV